MTGDAVDDFLRRRLFGLREIAQDIAGDEMLLARMPDPQPDAAEVFTDMAEDRAKSVIAAVAAARFDADFSKRQIQLVMKDEHIFKRDLEKAHRFADGLAGEVHICRGFEHKNLLAADCPLGDHALKADPSRHKGMAANNLIHRHKSKVMPVAFISLAGITEANQQKHLSSDQSSLSSSSASASAPSSAPPSSETPPDGAEIVAMVKSRSVMVGCTSSGSVTLEICALSPISSLRRSISINSGIFPAGTISSTSWRTTFRTPPRRMPTQSSSLRKRTGTMTAICDFAETRRKSTWIGVSLTGCSCRSRGRTLYLVEPT